MKKSNGSEKEDDDASRRCWEFEEVAKERRTKELPDRKAERGSDWPARAW